MTDALSILKHLNRLKDKPNQDVDFSFTNYTAQQLQFSGDKAHRFKYETDVETARDEKFHGAGTLQERQVADCACSRSCHCGERTLSKPVDLTPAQWRELMGEERQTDARIAQEQKSLNLNLRREKLASVTRSAIDFTAAPENVCFTRSQYVSPTYTTNLDMTHEKQHKKFYPQQQAQAKNAILAGSLPEIYRRQKGYAVCAPEPRQFDLVNQNRRLEVCAQGNAAALGKSQVLLTQSCRMGREACADCAGRAGGEE